MNKMYSEYTKTWATINKDQEMPKAEKDHRHFMATLAISIVFICAVLY